MGNKKTFTKRSKVLAITAVVLISIVGGSLAIGKNVSGKTIEVIPVSGIELGWWDGGETTSGTVTTDYAQTVTLGDTDTIQEIYVLEGQTVQVGTPLLAFDVTLLDLELSGKEYDLMANQTRLEIENKKLTNMKNHRTSGKSGSASLSNWLGGMMRQLLSMQKLTAADLLSGEDSGVSQVVSMPESSPESGENTNSQGEPSQVTSGEEASFPNILLQDTIPITAGKGTENSPYYYLSDSFRVTSGFIKDWNDYIQNMAKPEDVFVRIGRYVTGDEDKTVRFLLNLQFKVDGSFEFDFEAVEVPDPPTSSEEESKPESSQVESSQVESQVSSEVESQISSEVESQVTSEVPVEPEIPVDPEVPESYTDAQIKEQEMAIKNLELDIKLSQLEIRKLQNRYDDNVVYSTINGVVKSVQSDETNNQGEPVVSVVGNAGFYIQGTIGEFGLDSLQVGQTVNVMTYESGVSCEGTIVEILPYPTTGGYYYGEGNTNVSQYPFIVSVSADQPLSENEYAEIAFMSNEGTSDLYIMKAYTRTENGVTYALVDNNGVLEKRNLTTGKIMWGEYVQILSGLTREDYVAFPYGPKVKEGLKTQQNDEYSMW